MLLFLRKILFYVLVVGYLFVTPYTILYALGYIFNPAEIALVRTGLVSMETHPSGATVFFENRKFTHKTPSAVRDLLPGRYHLRLFRKGYEPWEKEITIEEEKATRLDPVVLLPRKFEDEVISGRSCEGMVPAVLDAKIFTWGREGLASLRSIDLFFRKETMVGGSVPKDGLDPIVNVQTKRKSSGVLVKVLKGRKKKYLLLNTEAKNKIRHLDPQATDRASIIDWDPRRPGVVYVLKEGILSRLDSRGNGVHPVIASDVLGFGLRDGRIIILKKDLTLMETNRQGVDSEPLVFDRPFLADRIFQPNRGRFYRILAFERDFLLFLSDEGELLSNRPPYHLVMKGVLGVEKAMRSDAPKVLYWTREKIGVVHFGQEKELLFPVGDNEEISWEEKPRQTAVYDQGKNIRQAQWAYHDSHILFVDEDWVQLAETENPPFHVRTISQVKPGTLPAYVDDNHSIFFVEAGSQRLIKRRLPD